MKQIIIFLIATSVAFTQVPQRIAFQGVLTESNGVVSTKTSGTFTFSIWDDELSTSTANRIWFESNVSLPLTRGMFSYVIGKSKQLTIAFDKPYWLEVQEGTTTLPRIELTSNAYSMRAAIADSAVRAPVSTTLTQLMRDEIAKMIKDSLSNQNIPNDVPVGTIIAYAGESVPTKWLACDGTAIDRSGANGYAELFTAIGTNWGSPNATQFNLPDLRGMFLRGVNGTRSDTLSDPNAATRFVNRTGGLTGNRVGSIQA
ncbi:MAG: tail fiber protein, partial [Candidatus Kapabacteria bacterium]|nr:tail fiber protein [Candidatus Kapabacteria bacterium]